MSYVDATDIAKQVRANVKAAQKAGELPPDVKVSVTIGRASMCSEVNVRIRGDKLTSEYLFTDQHRWTPQAIELAGKVRALMGPAEEWEDGRMKFACLYFRDGLCAP